MDIPNDTGAGSNGPAALSSTALTSGTVAPGATTPAGEPLPADTDGDPAPPFDPEPPIETPTPTQAEIDDAKRGVRQPDPPAAAKKVRNMKPGRDGASTTRDI